MKLENLKFKNFSPEEFYKSETARIHGIDNTPRNMAIITALFHLGTKLQTFRDFLGKGIRINSAYRSAKLNELVHGSRTSYHTQGLAADIQVEGMTLEEIANKIKESKITFDKCLIEPSQNCVHWQFNMAEDKNRNFFGKAKLVKGAWKVEQIEI